MYSTIETNGNHTKMDKQEHSLQAFILFFFFFLAKSPFMEVCDQLQVLYLMEAINQVKVDQMFKVSQSLIFFKSLKK